MIFIGILSLAGLALVVYDFMTLDVNKLAPRKFCDELIGTLEEGSLKSVKEMCSKNNNIISRIALSGIEKNQKGKGGIVVKEAMENTARIEIGNLWQNISYLSDIAQIAPLLGLLGTVLGMIQAFTVIVVQSAGVKPVMLAAGVSKAMITTAAGLIVAIPVLLFYAYFRGKVQEITNVVDTYSSDIIKIMEKL
jgi:biopolymer transport protein ExbB